MAQTGIADAGGRPTSAGVLIDPNQPGPLRADFYNLESLEAHARLLANECALAPQGRRSSPLLRQFAANERAFEGVHRRLFEGGDRRGTEELDAAWLVDNFHIIEEVLREVRRDLPRGYDAELPKLREGPLQRFPRVYALALSLVAHSDSELDEERITRFTTAFQEHDPLTIGELWALPTMLRLVLIDNLRRLSAQMFWGWDERDRAERWAIATAPGTVAELPEMSDPFTVRLLKILREQGQDDASTLEALHAQLDAHGEHASEILRREHQRQAVNQVSVGNCVTSLRLLSVLDWNTFVEGVGAVDAVLREDAGDVFAQQDFATRDGYRRAVEELSRCSGVDEPAVARLAVELARAERADDGAARHVGYYLVDQGRPTLFDRLNARPRRHERILVWMRSHPYLVYFGSISVILATILAFACWAGLGSQWRSGWLIGALLALAIPMSEIAVGLVNHLLTLLLPPRVLPKLEFKEGIPAGCETIVVMPTLLSRPGNAEALLSRLEIHSLANPDPRLRFALLTDFADAPHESMPEDESLIADALERLQELNAKYQEEGRDRFFLFHRRRLWNSSQNRWMGWERKRGKLAEFNRLLRGDRETSYHVLSADPDELASIQYVITLDADTQMPRDTASSLVGTIAHPLNRPRFDPDQGRVVSGYGVLQPRVSFHLAAASHSRFAALLAASGGIDPYSSAASDTYMDLFGIGSFTGKGIYDVDAFEEATGRTFPENQILSHDLIEGNYARCGLLSDTELFDDFPARYHAFARREHRWVRGDWQILPWLGRRVPSADGPRDNPLPGLERWKIVDNLRRSLVPPALLSLLVLGWTALPGSPWVWTLAALATLAVPLIQNVAGSLLAIVRNGSFAGVRRWAETLPPAIGQAMLSLVFLADQARLMVDAIARTLLRLFVTRRNLLEWETAAATERRLGGGAFSFFSGMWQAPVTALAIAALVALVRPEALIVASPALLAWLVSPLVAFWVSQPRLSVSESLSAEEVRTLRGVARRTWLFFETFVGQQDHWLPPDNFQEIPDGRVAHRTSPTNKGLLLLSTLSAHDLGYIGIRSLSRRLGATVETLERLETHWGHFYNWYETRTLQPLPPAYISTVDSGNLLACLVTLAQGLGERSTRPLLDQSVHDGLADTAHLAVGCEESLGAEIDTLLNESPEDLIAWHDWLIRVEAAVPTLIETLEARVASAHHVCDDAQREAWARRLALQARERREELVALAPWAREAAAWNNVAAGTWQSEQASARWAAVRSRLLRNQSLEELADAIESARAEFRALEARTTAPEAVRKIASALDASEAGETRAGLQRLRDRLATLATRMDFRPLYREDCRFFSIGCNLVQGSLDHACYDLLASESCLTSYLAVARGEAPRRHWFQLGRPFIRGAGRLGLLSWGGTMFEYLMPRLMLKSLPGTLLSEACRTAVARQIEYGRQRGVPWGISESSYNEQYLEGDYKYQSFGVPGLGLKRGLERDLVVAPYATALAAMVAPREAVQNFKNLESAGGLGMYGYYEAIDYTPERVPPGRRAVVVRSYMAHHQGMSLVALANAVLGDPMPRRFHAAPMVRAIELLLQERIPRNAPVVEPAEPVALAEEPGKSAATTGPIMSRRLTSPFTPMPRTHLLSNTRYQVMLTNAGSGWSTCRGLDVTRWREDATRDDWGQFYYVRDLDRALLWSAGYQPIGRASKEYEVIFATDKATFRRRDDLIETQMEITVSTEHDAEIRRITITNHDTRPRRLELTSYVEVVLGSRAADRAHPAFGKLFLETEWVPTASALLCRRRPRSADQGPIWAVHVSAIDLSSTGASYGDDVAFETDRARFVGRGRAVSDPAAMMPGTRLSGTTGAVLDPVLSLRRQVVLDPGGVAVISFTTAVASSREEALDFADLYSGASAVARTYELAWAHGQLEHRDQGRSPELVHLYQRFGSSIIFAGPSPRADSALIAANHQSQPDLWRHGISGDRPIVLARIASSDDLVLAQQLLSGHAYLRAKGLEFDLILLNEEPASYFEGLQARLLDLVRAIGLGEWIDRPGGIFVRKADSMEERDRTQLQAVARVLLSGDQGTLANQLDRLESPTALPPSFIPRQIRVETFDKPVEFPEGLLFSNGIGGFTSDAREYVIRIGKPPEASRDRAGAKPRPGASRLSLPPAPWVNVIANPEVGFLVSETGSGFTWAGNSQANRLTPWSNNPVSDPAGEALYLRDEETGAFWTATPLHVAASLPTLVRHGQGYTTFEQNSHGLEHEQTIIVAPDDPTKLVRLRVRNAGEDRRQLTLTYYAEWVLGTDRDANAMHVVTEEDAQTGAILARNPFRSDYGSRIAFTDVAERPRTYTTDRAEFLGRFGSLASPEAMRRSGLAGRLGAALDPCVALQVPIELKPGETRDVVFLLGEADDLDSVRQVVRKFQKPGAFEAAFSEVRTRWDAALGAIQVKTPDDAMNVLLNRWLPYQVLSCRMWGRSSFYQSGGAFGFRDQLQDSMALVEASPETSRSQLLLAASRQFTEGDAQHWWHPPTGRGVRTKCSDDYLWLPYVACHYARVTGDLAVFDEQVAYLSGPALSPGQEDDYGLPEVAEVRATLYEHCLRAIDHASPVGAHGLPLMGSGDWNDGMNRVGLHGSGESVWLAWFLIDVLNQFAEVSEKRGDPTKASALRDRAETLRKAVEATAWDGNWYRRAYFDDGTPMGSAENEECQIDSIAQSWAVISGAGDPERAQRAMDAVGTHLVRREDRLILLFAPPFDDGPQEPGYIKGYLPGIRENGGQYTHAATWVVLASALSGHGAEAHELFSLLNPVNHADTPKNVAHYKVEPYVVAADVYGRPPHVGRGGWTWYTGSASWLYRVAIEAMLGFQRKGDLLTIAPCVPSSWQEFILTYQYKTATYRIRVTNPQGVERGVASVRIDGTLAPEGGIRLADDGQRHEVDVVMGPA